MLVASITESSFTTFFLCSCEAIVFVTKHSSQTLAIFPIKCSRSPAGCRALLGRLNLVCKLFDRFAEMSFNESLRRNLRVDEAQFSIPKFLSLWPLLIYNTNIVLTMHLFTGFVQAGDYDRAVEEGSSGDPRGHAVRNALEITR